jgi:hypothetical protein
LATEGSAIRRLALVFVQATVFEIVICFTTAKNNVSTPGHELNELHDKRHGLVLPKSIEVTISVQNSEQ